MVDSLAKGVARFHRSYFRKYRAKYVELVRDGQSPDTLFITCAEGFSPNNIFAGFIVAVVALPLCIAFAIASGANPMAGIVSGVVGGLIAGLFGSSRFQASGPAAAFITIIYGLIAEHGPQVLLSATFLAGLSSSPSACSALARQWN